MQFFRRMELDWLPSELPWLRAELEENEPLWLANQNRQKNIRVQQHTQSIFLRTAIRSPESSTSIDDTHESRKTKVSESMPVAMAALARIAQDLSSKLGRALYARLLPRSVVYRHIDHGEYYAVRNRYHLVLQSSSGSVMQAGDERVIMQEGELWWFDNKAPHDSENPSDEWRVHLIFDLLPLGNQASIRDG